MSVEAISKALRVRGITPTQKLILIGIANHDGDGGAWPSIATLCEYADCDRRTAQRAIQALSERGFVQVDANAGGTAQTRNDRRPNRYVLDFTPTFETNSQTVVMETGIFDDPVIHHPEVFINGAAPVSPRDDDGAAPRSERGGVAVPPEPSLNHPGSSLRSEPRPPTPEIALSEDGNFEQFWSLYPNKVGKPSARLKYLRIRTSERDAVIAGLTRWIAYWRARNEPQFIPHPSTWLNQRRWEDSPPPIVGRKQGVGALGLTPEAAEAVRAQPRLTRAQAEALDATRDRKEISS